MTYSIRRLDPITDSALFAETYRWLEEAPLWRRETEAVFGTLDLAEWLAGPSTPGRCDIGIFQDGVFVANVILTLKSRAVYEVHFDARRGATWSTIVRAGQDIRDILFGRYGAERAVTWTPRQNRAVLSINRAIGFRSDNVSMLYGKYRGRPIEWVQHSLRKP